MPGIRRRSKARLIAKLFRLDAEEADKVVLKTENTEAVKTKTVRAETDSGENTLDTFKGTDIRAAHYYISANTIGDSDHQAQQIFVTHDGDNATLTSYGTLLHGNSTIVTYDASIDSQDDITITATPQTNKVLQFSFERVDVKKV